MNDMIIAFQENIGIVIAVTAFIICLIIGYFGDKYLKQQKKLRESGLIFKKEKKVKKEKPKKDNKKEGISGVTNSNNTTSNNTASNNQNQSDKAAPQTSNNEVKKEPAQNENNVPNTQSVSTDSNNQSKFVSNNIPGSTMNNVSPFNDNDINNMF